MTSAPSSSEQDLSLRYLHDSQNQNLDALAREDAFDALLQLQNGWWGEGRSLLKYTRALALALARRRTIPHGLSPDQLDWEGAAIDALLAIGPTVQPIVSPKQWLRGVVDNLLAAQQTKHWDEQVAAPVDASIRAKRSLDEDELNDEEKRHAAIYDEFLEAMDRLTPALKVVAQYHMVDRCSVPEISELTGRTQATIRKRLQRAREQLDASMKEIRAARSKEGQKKRPR